MNEAWIGSSAMVDEPHSLSSATADELHSLSSAVADEQGLIGIVIQVTGNGVIAICDPDLMNRPLLDAEAAFMPSGQIGSIVKIRVLGGNVFATVRMVRAPETAVGAGADGVFDGRRVFVDLDFMGHQVFGNGFGGGLGGLGGVSDFRRGVSDFPIPGQKVLMVKKDEVAAIFSAEGIDQIKVGTVYPHHKIPAVLLIDQLLSKHFAVLGSTGTGKSCTVSLLLHRLVERLPAGHIIVLDPHNEYGGAFADIAERFTTANLELPYWLMNFEEHVEVFVGQRTAERDLEADILKRCLLQARSKDARNRALARVTVDTPVPYKMSDLVQCIDTEMGRLDKPEKVIPYLRLKTKVEELRKDQRYGFMFAGLLLNDNLSEILARLLRFPVDGKPVSIIDLSGVPNDIVDVVVGILCRVVFDFALSSRGDNARPILVVCEEAHRYVPGDLSEAERQGRPSSARQGIERIAREGRKYGVSLGLVSQRPADLSEAALSQCGTILAMRMNNERDQAFVEHVLPDGAEGFLAALPSLQNREVIMVGEGVKAPVRVLLDMLPTELRPSSDSPRFSAHWETDTTDAELVSDVVMAWRLRHG